MRRGGAPLIAALWALSGLAAAADLDLAVPHRAETLASGLRVAVHADPAAPLFALELRYAVGAAEDTAEIPGFLGRPGMAHLVEHLMFEGSAGAPDGAYDRLLAAAGAESDAWTSRDWTAYTLVGPPEALPLALWLERDRMTGMMGGIDAADLENQRSVIADERRLARARPAAWERMALDAVMPGRHASPLGEEGDLAEATLAEVAAFTAAWYRPSNAVLVIGGAVDAEDALAEVRRIFGDLPSDPAPPRAKEPSGALPTGRVEDPRERTLYLAWATVPRGHPDEPALDLLADVLAARLVARVERGGLAEAAAWTENRLRDGRLTVELRRPRWPLSPRRLIMREIARLRAEPPTIEELIRQKARWRSWAARAGEALPDRVALLADCLAATGEADCLSKTLAARQAVTIRGVHRAAQRYLVDPVW